MMLKQKVQGNHNEFSHKPPKKYERQNFKNLSKKRPYDQNSTHKFGRKSLVVLLVKVQVNRKGEKLALNKGKELEVVQEERQT